MDARCCSRSTLTINHALTGLPEGAPTASSAAAHAGGVRSWRHATLAGVTYTAIPRLIRLPHRDAALAGKSIATSKKVAIGTATFDFPLVGAAITTLADTIAGGPG